ncbi:MAG: hypothetical protein M1817_001400 [Caeruleum heppii]|nr:MAG: hypothetical protein M1817_001400 [Caeruleum heppii]
MRLYNERDVLKLFQERAPSLRPLIDEIQDPLDPPSIVLKYLDQKLQDASNQERLTRPDIKFVARRVLEALQVLHEGGYTHTDVKPDNIMVNRAKGGLRFSDVQLADFGEASHIDSSHAQDDGLGDDDDPYEVKILLKNRQFFGLFPPSYGTIADDDRLAILTYVNNSVPPEDEKPFYLASSKEITAADRAFICKIMKLDPRDRPTAKQLLADEWFQVD